MARRLCCLVFVLLSCVSASAQQFITISGTAEDNVGLPYANGTIVATLNISGSPTLNGQTYTPPQQPFGLDVNGKFSFNLAANNQLQPSGSTWSFTVCSGAGTVSMAWGRQSVCFNANNVTLNNSQDITGQLITKAEPLTYSGSFLAVASPTCPLLHGLVDWDFTHPDPSGKATVQAAALSSQVAAGFAVFVPGAQCQGSVQVATGLVVPCQTDNQTARGDWVTSSPSVRGECTGYGPTLSGSIKTYGQVIRPNTGAGTVSMIYVSPFLTQGGGGGGGGWSPPPAAGDTLFGNNTVGTGTPTFFVPGGDVSFSAGNFWVNSLHFGPTMLQLANTGLTNGNFLQISSGQIIGAPAAGGLNGCATPTAGDLVCDNSVQGGTGNAGMLTLPYSGTNLPAPPTIAKAAIAGNASGIYWSPGNSTPFVALGAAAGAVSSVFGRTGAVVAANGDYSVGQVTGAAPLASPTFTGTPNSTTPPTADNSTRIATTAWVLAQGFGTGTGSVASVFGRTGVVVAANGDYSVGQITGAAPLASPTFTGTPNSTTPITTDDSTRIATTAWVKAQGYATAGGGQPPVVEGTANCNTNASAGTTLTITGLNIPAGVTVMVAVQKSVGAATITAADSGGSVYQTRLNDSNDPAGTLLSTQPGQSVASTSVTVTSSTASRLGACVVAYNGVGSFGTPAAVLQGTGTDVFNVAATSAVSGSVLFAVLLSQATGLVMTTPLTLGSRVAETNAVAPAPSTYAGICQNISAGGSVNCSGHLSANSDLRSISMVLVPSSGGGAPSGSVARINGGQITLGDGQTAIAVNTCISIGNIAPATGVQATDVVSWSGGALPSGWGNGSVSLRAIPYQGSVGWRACNNGASSVTPQPWLVNWLVLR